MKGLPYTAVFLGLVLVLSASLVPTNLPVTAAKQKATLVTVDEVPSKVRPGDKVTFTGVLTTSEGEPINQVPVNVYVLTSDPRLIVVASGVTGIEGTYEIVWDVELIPMDRAITDVTSSFDSQVFSLFVQFEGNENFSASRTAKTTVTIEINSLKTIVNSDKRLYNKGEVAIVFIGFLDSDDQFLDPESINANFNLQPVADKLEKKKVGSYTYTTPPLDKVYNQFSVVPKKEGYNIQTEVITITVKAKDSIGVFGGE